MYGITPEFFLELCRNKVLAKFHAAKFRRYHEFRIIRIPPEKGHFTVHGVPNRKLFVYIQDIAVARGTTYDTLNKRMDRCQANIEAISDDIQQLQGNQLIIILSYQRKKVIKYSFALMLS